MSNIILDTDSYKPSHYLQMPPGTLGQYAYLESRGGKYGHTVFFGLQYILKEYLTKPVTMEMVDEARQFFYDHKVPFNYEGWRSVAERRGGHLPIKIRAAKEGSVIPTHNVLMTVESDDVMAYWLVGWLETMLMRVWYPITVATQSWHIRQLIYSYLKRTSDDADAEIDFKVHDFGSRGVSSRESAAIGGAAHLVNSKGSDTVSGVVMANKYYHHKMAAFSVPAAEHSTIIAWGREREEDAYRNMLRQFARPGSIVAVVSDSYDLWNAVDKLWGEKLRNEVVASGATLVIRPDSGNPAEVVLKTLKLLEARFGASYNSKSYKVINNVRVLQGDGVNEESIREILETATKEGYSATNIGFGMGGALLQQVNRDTQRFAYKTSEVTIGNKRVPVCKDPVTDPTKRSKAGRLDLVHRNGQYQTVEGDVLGSELCTVYENGRLLKEYTLDEVRARASAHRA